MREVEILVLIHGIVQQTFQEHLFGLWLQPTQQHQLQIHLRQLPMLLEPFTIMRVLQTLTDVLKQVMHQALLQ